MPVKRTYSMKQACVPPSKSMMHRALFAAALTKGRSRLYNPSYCDDCLESMEVLRQFGAVFTEKKDALCIKGVKLGKSDEHLSFSVAESATTYRFLEQLLDAMDQDAEIKLGPSLCMRIGRKAYESSSQPLSGRMIAAAVLKKKTEIILRRQQTSVSYIDLTAQVLRDFGAVIWHKERTYKVFPRTLFGRDYDIEADWSAAAFWLLLAALYIEKGKAKRVRLPECLNYDSLQADAAVLEFLKQAGFARHGNYLHKVSEIKRVSFDFRNCPDLFPLCAFFAAQKQGEWIFNGLGSLQHKESNRLRAICSLFDSLRIPYSLSEAVLCILNNEEAEVYVPDEVLPCFHDHRIVFALTLYHLGSGIELSLDEPECVSKSWPTFWQDVDRQLGE